MQYRSESSKIEQILAENEGKTIEFKETDLLLLEPVVDKIIDYRKTFAELEIPCAELSRAVESFA